MNEKLKKALKIAGIIGLSALLFACGCGLGYCSAQKTGEPTKVLTERSRKNALITTENGGFEGYRFSVPLSFPSTENTLQYSYFSFSDLNSYTLTLTDSSSTTYTTDYLQLCSAINGIYDNYDNNQTTPGFLAVYGYGKYYAGQTDNEYFTYFTFINFNNYSSGNASISQNGFIMLDHYFRFSYSVSGHWRNTQQTRNDFLYLTLDKADSFYPSNGWSSITSVTFQDIVSYYKELGYSTGYGNGYNDGKADGYEEGFADGSGTGKMFTYLGINPMRWYKTNLTATDSTDTLTTYKMLTFKDGENASWSIFATYYWGGTLDTNNFSIDLFQGTTNNSANYRLALGTGKETSLGSGIWDVEPKDYATFQFAQIIDVYNNSLTENYFLFDGIPDNATGYQQGYQKGWNDGYNASPGGQSLDNVFSIFTKAFEATASFFNIKVFGFLPLYWFFLIPIFVAIITLLMRMIKH